MSEKDRKALPAGDPIIPDVYDFSGAPWVKIPEDEGEHLVELANSVNETVEHLYQKAIDRRNLERQEEVTKDLDYEIVHLMMRDVPEAIEDLGEHLEEARELEEEIGEGEYFGEGSLQDYGLSQDLKPVKEEKFLEHYREAEGIYREVFEQLGRCIGDQTVTEYLEDTYDMDMTDAVNEVPDPKPDYR